MAQRRHARLRIIAGSRRLVLDGDSPTAAAVLAGGGWDGLHRLLPIVDGSVSSVDLVARIHARALA